MSGLLTRLAWWWITREMRRDGNGGGSWAWAWHCNVAVCAQDEGMGHWESNKAASRFMRLAFGVDTQPTADYYYKARK